MYMHRGISITAQQSNETPHKNLQEKKQIK